jgi:membrane-associated phospholipid phosphatase
VLQSTEYRHFRNAVLFSLILASLVAIFLLSYGKEHSFLVINQYNSPYLDNVFRFWTFLGDGLIWIPLFAYVLIFRRDYLVAVLAGLIICTILTQVMKKVVFPEDYRPIVILGNKVRTIPGYFMNRNHSFPSGHTSTAFTFALLMAFIMKKNLWVYFFPLVAFFVGYSRVYLAQHFVTDVFAGMLIGVISSCLAILIYEKYRKRREGIRNKE